MANQLSINNVITISVSQANPGIGAYNTSNLALFTDEVPANSFGSLGYASYLTPGQVGTDFGTSSKTYQMALAVFSQSPNILNGNGQLIVILMTVATQNLAFSAAPASGTFVLNYGGHASAAINWNDTAAQIQVKVRAILGLEEAIVSGSISSTSVHVQLAGRYGVQPLLTVSANTLNGGITITVTTLTAGETITDAISVWQSQIQFFGIMATANVDEIGQTDLLAAAAVVLPLNKVAFWVSDVEADIQSGGMIDLLRTGSFTNSRGLYYGDTSAVNTLIMMASYAGRALSTNFSGSNTTQTMNLKVLSGVQPDPVITQTILNEAIASGADTYPSLQGVPSVYTSGLNGGFYDQIYGTQWFVGALQVAGFNFLAQAATKIPQTEQGMDGLKGAYRNVCNQAIVNQFAAPGAWNSPTTFGNQADFLANISQVGYYIFSTPINQQSQADRVARKAPLVQIALKLAGAIQSSNVIVTINP